MRLFYLLGLFILIGGSPWAVAHSLHLFAQYDGQKLSGRAYYSDQTPAAKHYLAIYQQNNLLLETLTDEQGRFQQPFALQVPITLIVEGEEGHKAQADLAPQSQETLPQPPQTQCQGEQQALYLLREDIDQLSHKLFWRDILGGIGYIFGVFGLWALFSTKRRLKESKPNKEKE